MEFCSWQHSHTPFIKSLSSIDLCQCVWAAPLNQITQQFSGRPVVFNQPGWKDLSMNEWNCKWRAFLWHFPTSALSALRTKSVTWRCSPCWRYVAHPVSETPPHPQAISISRQEGRMRSQEMMSEAKVMRQPKEKLKGEMTEIKHKVGKRTASIRLNRHWNPRRSHSDAKIISKRFRTPICYIAFMSIVPLVVQKHSHLLDLLTSLIKGGTFDALFA